MVIDTFALKVPVIGMLIRKVAVARFTRTLSTLISSGVPISRAAHHRALGRQPRRREGRDAGAPARHGGGTLPSR